MTMRNFKTRVAEHNRQIRNNNSGTQFSHFAEHILKSNHSFDINNTEILDKENNFYILRMKEKFYINHYYKTDDVKVVNEIIMQPPQIVTQIGIKF